MTALHGTGPRLHPPGPVASQYGYLPDAPKIAYLFSGKLSTPFSVYALDTRLLPDRDGGLHTGCPELFRGLPTPIQGDPFGVTGVLDFSSLGTTGLYQIVHEGRRSWPFWIREDLYSRVEYETFCYSRRQRCGCAIPGDRGPCHLDDPVPGGWHDAGDLRKWVEHTSWQALGIILHREATGQLWPVVSNTAVVNSDEACAELCWGLDWFLRMRDKDGMVMHDIGGQEEDNRWTDNIPDSGDERRLDARILPRLTVRMAWIWAFAARVFGPIAPAEGMHWQEAAGAAWLSWRQRFDPYQADSLHLSCAILAALELEQTRYQTGEAATLVKALLDRQYQGKSQPQGWFRAGPQDTDSPADIDCRIFQDWWQGSLLPMALLRAAEAGFADAADALGLWADGFILPSLGLSAFAIPPLAWERSAVKPGGRWHRWKGLGYRWFLPCGSGGSGQGTNTHLAGTAMILAALGSRTGKQEYTNAALRMLEWIHGANPFGTCLVSGRAASTPYPHSRYAGIIPGAVMNGITGDGMDRPLLGGDNHDLDWKTLEYWGPTQAQILATLGYLEASRRTRTGADRKP